ncbi:peptidylprolyl isomerase [Erythrobacter sp. JK5]|nr:peptidylprolyl isomerase [Erythrobacter sp. JK5]QUL37950.1 peptidylprolyl isomerase [Erythrobacter sp. JK5]
MVRRDQRQPRAGQLRRAMGRSGTRQPGERRDRDQAAARGAEGDGEDEYAVPAESVISNEEEFEVPFLIAALAGGMDSENPIGDILSQIGGEPLTLGDRYAELSTIVRGWPVGTSNDDRSMWPVHCYGMVGVGRSYSPDTGSGAELYTVIGHAPRHLDRNIALVGRIISGMEHLSSLPRGSGALGFYTEEEADKRTPILSIRVASDLPASEQPAYEYLSTDSETFAKYAEARANRRDPFFIVPAGGADICNIPVPIREVAAQ